MKEESRKRKVLDFKCKHGDGWECTAARRTKSLLLTWMLTEAGRWIQPNTEKLIGDASPWKRIMSQSILQRTPNTTKHVIQLLKTKLTATSSEPLKL